jgi:hypothetical protein
MDLLADSRSLIHTGRLYRQPEGGITKNDWTELIVLLFDNYCKPANHSTGPMAEPLAVVMTKPKYKDGALEYHVVKRVGNSFFYCYVVGSETSLANPSRSPHAGKIR